MASTTDYEEYAKDSPREHDASELSSDLAPKGGEGGGVLSGGPPQQQQQPPSEFPEGGTRAWLTVAGGWACLFVSFGWVNCVGIFQDYYESHQLAEYSSSEIAWIPALQVFFMLFSGIITGKLFDEFGPAVPLAVGSFLHVFGIMMISLSTEYYQILLSQSICSGIGASLVFFPSSTCASTWFQKKRGMALGIVIMGSSLGGVILPIMLIHLIPKVGFGWAIRICGFLVLAFLIFANIVVRSRIPPTRRKFYPMQFVRPLGELPFFLLTLGFFFYFWGMYVPITFIVTEARSQGTPDQLAKYLVPILNAGSVFGRTVPNILADKVGYYNMMTLMGTLTSLLILAVWIPSSGNAAIVVFAALFGAASGSGISLSPVLVAHSSPMPEIGTRTGVAFAMAGIATLTGAPIGGAIIGDQHGSYLGTKVFGGVTCAVGTLLFVAARVALVGPRKLVA